MSLRDWALNKEIEREKTLDLFNINWLLIIISLRGLWWEKQCIIKTEDYCYLTQDIKHKMLNLTQSLPQPLCPPPPSSIYFRTLHFYSGMCSILCVLTCRDKSKSDLQSFISPDFCYKSCVIYEDINPHLKNWNWATVICLMGHMV